MSKFKSPSPDTSSCLFCSQMHPGPFGVFFCRTSQEKGVWTEEELDLYINILEMKAVQLTWPPSEIRSWGRSVVLMNNNAMVVVYIKKQGGTVS